MVFGSILSKPNPAGTLFAAKICKTYVFLRFLSFADVNTNLCFEFWYDFATWYCPIFAITSSSVTFASLPRSLYFIVYAFIAFGFRKAGNTGFH